MSDAPEHRDVPGYRAESISPILLKKAEHRLHTLAPTVQKHAYITLAHPQGAGNFLVFKPTELAHDHNIALRRGQVM